MRNNYAEGNEFPNIDMQPTSTAHVDRYTNRVQNVKKDEKEQKKEIEQNSES